MKYPKLIKTRQALGGLLAAFGLVIPVYAVDTLSIDMDVVTPGIQSVRVASPGDTFTVGLVLTVDAAGVSSYGISALFNNTELSLDGSPAATEFLPAGFDFNFTAGVASESNPLGQVYTFEAATFGLGPVSTSFSIGTINFTAVGVLLTDAVPDITPGFFNTGIDGMFDNASGDVEPTTIIEPGFLNAAVVPEASPIALFYCGMLLVAIGGRRLRQSHLRSVEPKREL